MLSRYHRDASWEAEVMPIGDDVRWEDDLAKKKFLIRGRDLVKPLSNIWEHGQDKGVSTGFENLDPFYRVKPGHLVIISGAPGHGKSEIVDAICVNLAQTQGWNTMMFSPENQPYEEHAQKLVEKHVEAPLRLDDGKTGVMERMRVEDLSKGLAFIDKHFMWVDIKNDDVTLDKLFQSFCSGVDDLGAKICVLDPWGDIEHKRGKMNETEYISYVLSILRDFARIKKIVFFLVAHPAKQQKLSNNSYGVCDLWSISGSAAWRNKADIGIIVYRPDMTKNVCEVHVQKVRFKNVGTPGVARFAYDKDSGVFTPLAMGKKGR